MHHNGGFNTVQRSVGLLLVFCAFMVIPLSLGVVVLNKINNSSKQVSAQVPPLNKCDLNKDNLVNKTDVEIASLSFGQVKTDAAKLADIDGNGWVNSVDLLIISKNDPVKCQGMSNSPVPSPFVSPLPIASPTPGLPSVGCQVNAPVSVKPGSTLSVFHNGFAAGESIKMSGLGAMVSVGITVDSTSGTKEQKVTIPPTLVSGTYRVIITTRFPVTNITCTGSVSLQPIAYNRCDFNKDGVVNTVDQNLLGAALNTTNSVYDLNSDGRVNSGDQVILAGYITTKTSKYCIDNTVVIQ